MTSELFSGGLAGNPQQRLANLSTDGSSLGSIAARFAQNEPASETQTAQAVQAAEDSVSVNNQLERATELQSILAQLTSNPTDAEAVVAALESLQDFAATETNSAFGDSVIGQLADVAEDVLGAIGDDPAALGQSFAFSFSANFSENTLESEDFYSSSQSLEVSFSINTATTAFSGDFSFSESTEATADGISYQSQESVSLRYISFDNNQQTNPLLDSFASLTEELTGVDVLEVLGIEGEDDASQSLLAAPSVDVREFPLFAEFFERLNSLVGASEQTSRLLDGLRERLAEVEEPAAA